MSTALSQLDAFTVEYFVRLDRASGNSDWFCTSFFNSSVNGLRVSIPDGIGGGWRIRYYVTSPEFVGTAPNTADLFSTQFSFLNVWRHIAVVYSDGKITCYVDRRKMESGTADSLVYDNTPWTDGGQHPLRFGNATGDKENNNAYQLHGAIACPRVTAAALQPEDFLFVRDVPLDVSGGTLAFWPFKDGATGTDASTLQNTGARAFTAVASAQGGGSPYQDCGNPPQFSSDIPGKYIFQGAERVKRNLVAEQPQSLRFYSSSPDSASHSSAGGGKVTVEELGSWLMAQPSYTVECFFKFEDTTGWGWRTSLCGWTYGGYYHRLSVWAKTSGAKKRGVECGAGSDDNASNYMEVWGVRDSEWDSDWHHVAYVRDGKTGRSTVYYDHELCGNEAAVQLPSLDKSFDALYEADRNFIIGTEWVTGKQANYTFRGKIACVRVSACARTPDDFLYAFNRGPTGVGTLVFIK